MVFGIIPECRSASLRIERSPSPESPQALHTFSEYVLTGKIPKAFA